MLNCINSDVAYAVCLCYFSSWHWQEGSQTESGREGIKTLDWGWWDFSFGPCSYYTLKTQMHTWKDECWADGFPPLSQWSPSILPKLRTQESYRERQGMRSWLDLGFCSVLTVLRTKSRNYSRVSYWREFFTPSSYLTSYQLSGQELMWTSYNM